ncbi:MAG TPA: tail fiber domain-containing protein, partial [Verrucomicrobiae bacterium]
TNASVATIAGGGHNLIQTNARAGTIGGGEGNTVQTNSSYGTISGGAENTVWANAYYGTVAGGWVNAVGTNAIYGSIGGGWNNTAGGAAATVAGGSYNAALADWATISGGRDSLATNTYATMPGGRNNLAGGSYSFAAGRRAKALHDGAFVWADSTDADFVSTSSKQFLIRASGGVGIGVNNPAAALDVAGTVKANALTVGSSTVVTNLNAELLGGLRATNFWQLGGNSQTTPGQNCIGTTDNQSLEFKVSGTRALRLEPNTNGAPNVIGGAPGNWIAPQVVGSVIAGGGVATNLFGHAHTNGVSADSCFLGGGWDNSIQTDAWGSFLGGGSANSVQTNARGSFLGGGWGNSIQIGAFYSFLGGGGGNFIQTNAYYSLLGGGYDNTIKANASFATLSGGSWNGAGATSSTVAGGFGNTAAGMESVVGGGYTNTANGLRSTVPGGYLNVAGGDYSFAAGRRAKAMAYGDFVWADSADADFSTYVPDQFAIRAAGGVYVQSDRGIALNAANRPLITRGWDAFDATAPPEKLGLGRWGLFMEPYNLVIGIPGDDTPGRNFQVGKYARDGSWMGLMLVDQTGMVQARLFNPTSDRAAKENFAAISPREILAKVADLPLSRWNFKQEPSAPHLGPVAQDFHAAFGLGNDDKHISTVDADGVALAAIQGLNQKVESENAALRAENAELRTRLEQLELRVSQMKGDTE